MSDDEILHYKRRRLRELQKKQARAGISTPAEIEVEIDELAADIAQHEASAARAALPHPPQPNFAHPYPIQSGFTGRVRERTMLSRWLGAGAQPVLAVIGIGGMGKSALGWAWLQRDVLGLALPGATADAPADAAACRLPEAARPEGVLWWSFYETGASFEAFLNEAIVYASAGDISPRDLPSTHDKVRALLGLLQTRRLLLVLDGFERELRAYASLGAAYQGDAVAREQQGEHRACGSPHAARFLRAAATLPLLSRILVTSRLFPRELDELAGCDRHDLERLDPDDAVAFFQTQGIRGTRAEIMAACAPYGYHALALRLLAGVVKNDPTRPGDIQAAPTIETPYLVQREHHILEIAYNALQPPLQTLLGMLAAFRSPVAFDTIKAIDTAQSEQPSGLIATLKRLFKQPATQMDLKAGLGELVDRGLLFFDRQQARYDLHPVVRGYAYERLVNKSRVHIRLYDYFAAIPAPDKNEVQGLDDLLPVIELYHHTVRAGRYDQAAELFHDRLHDALYYRLGAYQTCIELLLALFPDGEAQPPRLSSERAQAWALTALANAYSLAGQPRRAVPIFEQANIIVDKQDNKKNLAIGLGNLACMAQVILGELAAAERNLRRSVELRSEIEFEVYEAVGHQELGRLLAYQGLFDEAGAELELARASFERQNEHQSEGIVWAYRALCALLMHRPDAALDAARRARELADVAHYERDIIQAEWLIGAALVAQAEGVEDMRSLLTEAEAHLTAALTRCRKINLIELEPDILLAWATWHRHSGNAAQARADANEALAIADRCEYRLKQADIHLFLARLAMDAGQRAEARQHATTAHARAWCDGPPHCYKPALDAAAQQLAAIGQ
jgi:tetratricopeptide (TPR) repeat protein